MWIVVKKSCSGIAKTAAANFLKKAGNEELKTAAANFLKTRSM